MPFNLVRAGLGKFFDVVPARAAIEKIVQPATKVNLSSLGKTEWLNEVRVFFSKNAGSIITAITAVDLVADVRAMLSPIASTDEEQEELNALSKILSSRTSAPGAVSKASAINPVSIVDELVVLKEHRDVVADLGAMSTKDVKRFVRSLMYVVEHESGLEQLERL